MAAESADKSPPPALEDILAKFITQPVEMDGALIAKYASRWPQLEAEIAEGVRMLRALEAFQPEPQFAPFAPGAKLGDYEILHEIGRGAIGIVYRARQRSLDRTVALKVLPPSLSITISVIQRFLREAQAVARVEHPNIVRIYSVGEEDGIYFYAMELLEGGSLSDVIRALASAGEWSPRLVGDLPTNQSEGPPIPGEEKLIFDGHEYLNQVSLLIAQVVDGLQSSHSQGIIHRDIKPANILFRAGGAPVLVDFGLAQFDAVRREITETGVLVGTPAYMSPEQVTGKSFVDARSDVYSVGLVLYELATLRPAFEANSTLELLHAVMSRDPIPPARLNRQIDGALEAIIMKCIEKDPARRYDSARALGEDLRRYVVGEAIAARPSSLGAESRRLLLRLRGHRKIVVVFAFILAAAALSLLAEFFFGAQSRYWIRMWLELLGALAGIVGLIWILELAWLAYSERRRARVNQGTYWRTRSHLSAARGAEGVADDTVTVARYLEASEFKVRAVRKNMARVESTVGALAAFSPIQVMVRTNAAPSRSEIRELSVIARQRGRESVAILVYNDPPDGLARAAIAEAWRIERVSIVPLEIGAVRRSLGAESGAPASLLSEAFKRYGPHSDLFSETGAISDPLAFYGRDALINQVRGELLKGKCIALIGLRKAGKTSVLNALLNSVRDRPMLYIDMEGFGGAGIAEKTFKAIIQGMANWMTSVGDRDAAARLLGAAARFGHSANGSAYEFQSEMRAACAVARAHNCGLPLVILLDEVDHCIPMSNKESEIAECNALFGALRSLNQKDNLVSFIIADLHPTINRINYWMDSAPSNPVFRYLSEIYVGPFDPGDTYRMLTGIGELMGLHMSKEICDLIQEESGGQAVVSRQIASQIARLAARRPGISIDDVKKIIEGLFDDSDFYGSYCRDALWTYVETRAPGPAVPVMELLARNDAPRTLTELLNGQVRGTEAEIRDCLGNLRRYGLITWGDGGGAIRIRARMLRRWIQMNMAPDSVA